MLKLDVSDVDRWLNKVSKFNYLSSCVTNCGFFATTESVQSKSSDLDVDKVNTMESVQSKSGDLDVEKVNTIEAKQDVLFNLIKDQLNEMQKVKELINLRNDVELDVQLLKEEVYSRKEAEITFDVEHINRFAKQGNRTKKSFYCSDTRWSLIFYSVDAICKKGVKCYGMFLECCNDDPTDWSINTSFQFRLLSQHADKLNKTMSFDYTFKKHG